MQRKKVLWIDDDTDFLEAVSQMPSEYDFLCFKSFDEFEQWADREGRKILGSKQIVAAFLDFLLESNVKHHVTTTSSELEIPKLLREVFSFKSPIFMCSNYDLDDDDYCKKFVSGKIRKKLLSTQEIRALIESTKL